MHRLIHAARSLAQDINDVRQVNGLFLHQSVCQLLNEVLLLGQHLEAEVVLLSHYAADFFVDFPVGLVGVGLLKAFLSHHGAVAHQSYLIIHTISLHKSLDNLSDLINIVTGPSGHRVIEDLFGYAPTEGCFDHVKEFFFVF